MLTGYSDYETLRFDLRRCVTDFKDNDQEVANTEAFCRDLLYGGEQKKLDALLRLSEKIEEDKGYPTFWHEIICDLVEDAITLPTSTKEHEAAAKILYFGLPMLGAKPSERFTKTSAQFYHLGKLIFDEDGQAKHTDVSFLPEILQKIPLAIALRICDEIIQYQFEMQGLGGNRVGLVTPKGLRSHANLVKKLTPGIVDEWAVLQKLLPSMNYSHQASR